MPSISKPAPAIFQLKVTLKQSKPPIWRRIQVRSDTKLPQLHNILQLVMGWDNAHLHQFIVGRTFYSSSDPDFGSEEGEDEAKFTIAQLLPAEKKKLVYEYDFGDSWEHEILLEKILAPAPDTHYPVCLTGKRACPPEDCGGIWGYEDLLETIQDANHPEHQEMLEWVGGAFDPEAFDLQTLNARLCPPQKSEKKTGKKTWC